MGLHDTDKIRVTLDLPEGETIVSVIVLGYAAKESVKPKRKEVGDILKSIEIVL